METKKVQDKRAKEKKVVGFMIELYCVGNHGTRPGYLCRECSALQDYASARVDHCPHMASKTFCSNCRTPCYRPDMREKIRRVMRWSGPRMIWYHPIMATRHVTEMMAEKKKLRQG